jgi:hypothetical protein
VEFAKIVLLSVTASIAFGVFHDQITARVCIQYFTIGHPPLIESTSATMLGMAWGIVATWWVGLPLGVLLAASAQLGVRPKIGAKRLVPGITMLMGVVALLAFSTGTIVYALASTGRMHLSTEWAELLPFSARIPFLVDMWTHIASYLFGVVGGLFLVISTFKRRGYREAI